MAFSQRQHHLMNLRADVVAQQGEHTPRYLEVVGSKSCRVLFLLSPLLISSLYLFTSGVSLIRSLKEVHL